VIAESARRDIMYFEWDAELGQKSQQADQRKAAEKHRPISSIKA
jgi:hypothetical protein